MATNADILARVQQLEAKLAERDRQLAERDAEIATLKRRVAELEERLNKNSSNSGKPPSSDSPSDRAARRRKYTKRRKRSGKRRGGQRGHKGHQRELVPLDQVDEVVQCRPTNCRTCGDTLPPEQEPVGFRRDQVFELPPLKPEVTEYQHLQVPCPCGTVTEGDRPADAPPGGFGPRLTAFAAMLTGVYHLGRRKAVELLRDGLGVRMSLGALSTCERRVSDALEQAHAEAQEHVASAETRHIDATTWWSGTTHTAVWVVATSVISFLAITVRSTRAALMGLVGRLAGRVVCDRATVFNCWKGAARQTCWAHLLRYFEGMAARDGPSARIGHDLCLHTLAMFSAWHDFKAGGIDRAGLRAALREPRGDPPEVFVDRFRALLEQGTSCGHEETEGTCRNLLTTHWDEMWTFVDVEGVEPTNNHAEQELRPAVLWRKTSFGSQSDRGDRFAERILTAARSLRKQSRHLHSFLVASLRASWNGACPPSLLPRDHDTP